MLLLTLIIFATNYGIIQCIDWSGQSHDESVWSGQGHDESDWSKRSHDNSDWSRRGLDQSDWSRSSNDDTDWSRDGGSLLGLPLFVFKEIQTVDDRIDEVIRQIDEPQPTVIEEDDIHLQRNQEGPQIMSLTVFAEDDSKDTELELDPLGTGSGLDVVDLQELLVVLGPALDGARCSSTCRQTLDTHAAQVCHQTCTKLYENVAWRRICGTETCGFGCTAACTTLEVEPTLRNRFSIQGSLERCALYWTANSRRYGNGRKEDTDNFKNDVSFDSIDSVGFNNNNGEQQEFLVAAQDESGMFYNVGTTANYSLNLPDHILIKAARILVISVGPAGPSGLTSVRVEEEDRRCRLEVEPSRMESSTLVLPVAVLTGLSVLLLVLLAVLVLVSARYTKQQRTRKNLSEMDSEKCTESSVYGDFHPYRVYISSPVTL